MPYSFVSEKEIDGSVYQAVRSQEDPSITLVTKDGEPFAYEGNFKQFWINLN